MLIAKKDRRRDEWITIESIARPIGAWWIDLLTKVQKQFSGEKMVFTTKSTGRTGYAYSQKWTLTHCLHYMQKLTQNGS